MFAILLGILAVVWLLGRSTDKEWDSVLSQIENDLIKQGAPPDELESFRKLIRKS